MRDFAVCKSLDAVLADHPKDREALLLAAPTARRSGDGRGEKPIWRYQRGDLETVELERKLRGLRRVNSRAPTKSCNSASASRITLRLRDVGSRTRTTLFEAAEKLSGPLDLWMACICRPRIASRLWPGRGRSWSLRAWPRRLQTTIVSAAIDPDRYDARLRLAHFLTRHQPKNR